MFHKMILAGHLGRDPEMRYLNDGTPVTNFNVAINDGYGDKKRTIWVRCTAWNKQAENVNTYLSQGSKVLVEGRLQCDGSTGGPKLYTRHDGSTGSSFEMTAYNVTFLGSNGTGNADNGSVSSAPAANSGGGFLGVEEEDDIPFARPRLTERDGNPIGISAESAHLLADFPIA